MSGYPKFSLWNLIVLGIIYLSHIVINWKKYFPLVGTRTLNNRPIISYIHKGIGEFRVGENPAPLPSLPHPHSRVTVKFYTICNNSQ